MKKKNRALVYQGKSFFWVFWALSLEKRKKVTIFFRKWVSFIFVKVPLHVKIHVFRLERKKEKKYENV